MDTTSSEQVAAPITLEDFQEEIKKLKELKTFKEQKEDELEQAKATYKAQGDKIMAHMQAHEMRNFKVDGIANVTIANKFYCAYPQAMEDINKFHDYLEKIGRGHERKLHSQTLSTMVNEAVEAAKERGEPYEPLPGLGLPSIKQELRVLKG